MKNLNEFLPVTTALRKALENLNIEVPTHIYSDSRMNGKALGVKFVGLRLRADKIREVQKQMEKWGYTHHYTRYNFGPGSQYSILAGLRFCYSTHPISKENNPPREKTSRLTPENITQKDINNLLIDQLRLRALMNAGVNNWEGWTEATSLFADMRVELKLPEEEK